MTAKVDWRIEDNQKSCSEGIEHAAALIRQLAEPHGFDAWFANLLIGILQTGYHSSVSLRRGWAERDVPLTAWGARNSLEVMIWMKYVTSSVDSAVRFHLDWLNDTEDILSRGRKLDKFGPTPAEAKLVYPDKEYDYASVEKAERMLSELRDKHKTRKEPRLDIRKIAKAVNCEERFNALNPILSKFIHATAVSVLSFPTDSAREGMGLLFIDGAFYDLVRMLAVLDKYLIDKTGRSVFSPTIN